MEIGIDDFIDDDYGIEEVENTTTQDTIGEEVHEPLNEEIETSETIEENDFIADLLKTRGIEDKSRIKFQDDNGEINEVDWSSLSREDQLNILNSSSSETNSDLYDDEIQLINAIRQSKLNSNEYIQAIQQDAINKYIQSQNQQPVYKIDEISDEELFVSDLITRAPEISDEEAKDALDRIKSNETLFKKQIEALRTEYKRLEDEQIQYAEMQQQQKAQDQFNQFAESIENSIINFTEFSGCELNMDQEDMQELYDFITGFDNAGISHLGKALNDPNTLVRMAWFALNGEKMINDINEYYKKEIASVRKESYNKGLQKKQDKPQVVHKPTVERKKESFDAFDDLD